MRRSGYLYHCDLDIDVFEPFLPFYEAETTWYMYRETDNLEYLFEHLPSSITHLSLPYYLSTDEPEKGDPPSDWNVLLTSLKARSKRGKTGVPIFLPSFVHLEVGEPSMDLVRWREARDMF
ncbi:hypothetical protein JCM11641_001982 [Rhodosporidiobolus odoratus]